MRDISDVAATDADVIQFTVAQVLQLGIGALILSGTGTRRFDPFDHVLDPGAEVEAVMCQCCCCHFCVPFSNQGEFPDVSLCVPCLDKVEIGVFGIANNGAFGLADMHLLNGCTFR